MVKAIIVDLDGTILPNREKHISPENTAALEEAARRGLLNLRSTPDALPLYTSEKNVSLFTRHGVYTVEEMKSREEIGLEEYAKTIAEWMMDDGTESTLSGSWAVPFGNLQKRFGVDLKTDTDLRDRVSRVLYDQSDIVADFCMEEDRVRLDFFYSRCPHVYEHGAETAEPAMDQSM